MTRTKSTGSRARVGVEGELEKAKSQHPLGQEARSQLKWENPNPMIKSLLPPTQAPHSFFHEALGFHSLSNSPLILHKLPEGPTSTIPTASTSISEELTWLSDGQWELCSIW